MLRVLLEQAVLLACQTLYIKGELVIPFPNFGCMMLQKLYGLRTYI